MRTTRSRHRLPGVIFVTGTDTGVGKTLLTALMLQHLRQGGLNAVAVKPFCTGGRGDVRLLQSLQKGVLPDSMINPYYFPAALAPLVAAQQRRVVVRLRDAEEWLEGIRRAFTCVLVEGAGGLLTPLGEGYSLLDLIVRCDDPAVIVVAHNRLGTINHALLAVTVLSAARTEKLKVVLMNRGSPDSSAQSNPGSLQDLLVRFDVRTLPWLGPHASKPDRIRDRCKKLKKVLADLLDFGNYLFAL